MRWSLYCAAKINQIAKPWLEWLHQCNQVAAAIDQCCFKQRLFQTRPNAKDVSSFLNKPKGIAQQKSTK